MGMPSASLRTFLGQAAEAYHKQAESSGVLSDYLSSRGIDAEVADRFGLGLCSSPLAGHERFVGCMSIPYLTPTGVVAMKFRRLSGEGPKYDQPSGQEARLFNVEALWSREDFILVCEGELDTIVASGVCGLPAVGIAGTNGWKDHYGVAMEGFRHVFLLMDNDDKDDGSNPGQDAARRISKQLPEARPLRLPPGMDVNLYVLSAGPAALVDLVRSAT